MLWRKESFGDGSDRGEGDGLHLDRRRRLRSPCSSSSDQPPAVLRLFIDRLESSSAMKNCPASFLKSSRAWTRDSSMALAISAISTSKICSHTTSRFVKLSSALCLLVACLRTMDAMVGAIASTADVETLERVAEISVYV